MTKKEKFDVAVAAFEALLGRNGLWSVYLMNFKQCNQHVNSEEIYTNWKQWALNTTPYRWVASAFIWNETQQTHYAWKELDYQWLLWICKNLNN